MSSKSLNSFPERRFEYFIYLMSINIENSTNIKNLLGGEGCLWYLEELSDHSQHGGHVSVISGKRKTFLRKLLLPSEITFGQVREIFRETEKFGQ